jgi:hypothetical protein
LQQALNRNPERRSALLRAPTARPDSYFFPVDEPPARPGPRLRK